MGRLPTVLYINAWDGEDYGVQYMYDGLCDLLGWAHVIDWPSCPFNHVPVTRQRSYDSQLHWPERRFHEWEIHDLLRNGSIDLVVISSARDPALGTVRQLAPWLGEARSGIVLLDMEDSRELTVTPYLTLEPNVRWCIRAIFKREVMPDLPPTSVPIFALPFGYPRSRIAGLAKRAEGALVFYRACDWGWPPDSPRHRMVAALKARFGDRADVGLSTCVEGAWTDRLTIAEYQERLQGALVGIALNEGGGSDNNRYWEVPASGAVLVSDHPRHEIPNNFEHGREAFFYRSIEEAVDLVAQLDAQPELCHTVAQAGQIKLWQAHTTAARANYLLGKTAEASRSQGKPVSW